jgi:hypothetical protein
MRRTILLLAAMALSLLVASGVALAGSIAVDTSPGTAAPPPTLGPYTMTPFAADGRPLGDPVTDVAAPAGAAGSLQFDRSLTHSRIGSGWQTWSHGYTGDVYWTDSSDRVVMALPANTQAFYFYAEPNDQAIHDVTATASDGTTSGPVKVNGLGGAQYYGFYTTDGTTLSTITVDADPTAFYRGFAVGEFGIAVDTTPPKVISTVPAATAKGVAPGANITATFSEAMDATTTDGDPNTINTSTFKLMKAGTTTLIGAVVSYDPNTNTAILDPNANLKLGTKYKAVVTTGAQDVAGNRLDQDQDPSNGLQQKGWSFTIKN